MPASLGASSLWLLESIGSLLRYHSTALRLPLG